MVGSVTAETGLQKNFVIEDDVVITDFAAHGVFLFLCLSFVQM